MNNYQGLRFNKNGKNKDISAILEQQKTAI